MAWDTFTKMAAQVGSRGSSNRTPGLGGGAPLADRTRTPGKSREADIVPLMNGAQTDVYIHGAPSTNGDANTENDDRQGLVSKRSSNTSTKGLTRTDSGKSAHSLGALSYYNYDPKTTGSLSRSEEVTISMYDQSPDRKTLPTLTDAGSSENLVESQWRADSEQGGISGRVVRDQTNMVATTAGERGSKIIDDHQEELGASGEVTRTTSVVETTSTKGHGATDPALVTTTVTSATKRSSSSTGSTKTSVNGDLGSPTRIKEGSVTSGGTSSLDRTAGAGRPRKPGSQASGGSFQIRSAYNSVQRSEPISPAASDDKFIANLEDSISRKVANAAATKTQTSTQRSGSAASASGKGQDQAHKVTTSTSRTSSAREKRISVGDGSSHAAQEGKITRSGTDSKKNKSTENVIKTTSIDRVSRADSGSSQRARGSTEITKRESARSATSATDPGRPPSGRPSRLSRTSSASDSAPISPRGPSDTTPLSSPTTRTESQKSTTSIKSSSIDRLAEPKRRKSSDGGRKSPAEASGRGSTDVRSSKRTSVPNSPSTKRSSVTKHTETQTASPAGSRSSSKEGRSSSTEGTTATDKKNISTKVTTTTVTKTESNRSGATPGFAASTTASSAKRSESSRSSRASGAASATRTGSSASEKGRFSIKSASTTASSPPGSVFNVNDTAEASSVTNRQSSSTDVSPNRAGKAKRSSSGNERKVTAALVAAAKAEEASRSLVRSGTPVNQSTKAERTPSFTKAHHQHKEISKNLFSELHSKHGATSAPDDYKEKRSSQKSVIESEKVIDVGVIKPKVSSTQTAVDSKSSKERVGSQVMTETVVTTTTTSSSRENSRPPSLLEKRRISRDSLTLDLSGVSAKSGKDGGASKVTSTQQRVVVDGMQEDIISSAPVSPLLELEKTVTHGTVDRLVNGRFKDLNLTARFGEISSLERKAKEKGEADDATAPKSPKYKFPVEGIDIPAEEGNKEGLVESTVVSSTTGTSEITVDHGQLVTSPVSPTALTEADLSKRILAVDDRGSESGSLERAQKLKRGFTYLRDENLAREVTQRATTVTARRPHEVADARAEENKTSTLERERAEKKALQAARPKLKAQPFDRPTSPLVRSSEQELAYTNILHGIRDHSEKKRYGEDTVTTVVNGNEANPNRDGSGGQFQVRSSTERPGSKALTSVNLRSTVSKDREVRSAGVQKKRPSEEIRVTSDNIRSKPSVQKENTKMAEASRKVEHRGRAAARGGSGGIVMSPGGDMGQLSPDSAYQSDTAASPVVDSVVSLRDTKLNGTVGVGSVQPQEVTVQRVVQDATVAQGSHSRFESKQTVVNESKASNKTIAEPATGVKAQRVTRVNEYKTSQQSQHSSTYTDAGTSGGKRGDDDGYLVSTRRNESITKYATPTVEVPITISSTTTGSSASTYATSNTNFGDRFKPAELGVRDTKHSGRVAKTTAGVVASTRVTESLHTDRRTGTPIEKHTNGSSVTAESVSADVTSQQTTTSSSTSRALEGRSYLPVSEGGGVHLTIGPEPGTSSEDATAHVTHDLQRPALQDSSMRIENKENVSHVMRESHHTATSSYVGGSERQPVGQQSSFGSSDYSAAGGRGRVIPLAPLTVDINTPNDSFEMATHPASVTSPTVKHTMSMFEMNEMTDGASGNFGRGGYDSRYDGSYSGNLQHGGYSGSRYAPPPRTHLDDGSDFQNLHNLRNTYQEQTLSSQQSYRTHPHDVSDSGGFDTVSRSFRHIPGSPSHPKYLKVDESRVGKMPMYRDHEISVQEGSPYRSDIRGYAGRQQRNDSYVSRAYVDGDHPAYHGLHVDPFDGDSVQSEPMYNRTRRSEKILAARRPIRRHASSNSDGSSQTLPGRHVHVGEPMDMGYPHSVGYTDAGYRSHQSRSATKLYSSPGGGRRDDGPLLVSPELQDAKKRHDRFGDDQYHITVKLNQLNKDRYASQHNVQAERYESRDERYSHRNRVDYDNMHTSSMSLPDMAYGAGGLEVREDYSMRDGRYNYADDGYRSPTRTVTQLQLDSPPIREHYQDRISWYRALRAQRENQAADQVNVRATDRYHTVSNNTAHSKVSNDTDYAMNINQTMKMDYMPTQHVENHISRQHETYVNNVRSQSPSRSTVVITSDVPERRKVEERTVRTTRTYREEGEDHSGDELPQVVTGSILIKNRIDTTGAPQVIDVVADEYDDTFTVEDNTNVFQEEYRAVRENPMYNSDEDLTKLMERSNRPSFTKIFKRHDEEDFTEIPVNYKSSHTRTKGRRGPSF